MKRRTKLTAAAVVVIAVGAAGAFAVNRPEAAPAEARTVEVAHGSVVEKAMAVGTIEPRAEVDVKSKVSGVVRQLFAEAGDFVRAGAPLVERWIVPDAIIRKLVATVDNLPHEALWMKSRVVPAVEGRLQVTGPEDALRLAEGNFARYAPLVRLVAAVDAGALAAAYHHHYPLLQQAYEELGYPGRQFHYRAIEVIDHLLATPEVQGPILLVQPHVLYRYADPKLEALSSGQKILLRIGPDHGAVVRTKLIELRAALAALAAATLDD